MAPATGPSAETWTAEYGKELQTAVDAIFSVSGDRLKGIKFSLTIADPSLKDCPLIGCSEGFTELCGYCMEDIVGRNCRFLVDPVPKEKVSANVRTIAREFNAAARDRKEYIVPERLREDYMPKDAPSDYGVFLFQTNARKDGSLFKNMFYMRTLELNEKPYIIGLQTEIEGDDMTIYQEACRVLDENMVQVERMFGSRFWLQCGMRRQDEPDQDDGFVQVPTQVKAAGGRGVKQWSAAQADELQAAVDKVFGTSGDKLAGLQFSLTLADPLIPECPLIGCSTGFGTLCGYKMDEIVGRNCRFLIDPVPKNMISSKVRILAKRYCDAVRDNVQFKMTDEEQEPWMLKARASDDGVFCAQMNARKDGSLFENMFYMRRVELDDHPYIIGLQTGLPPGSLANDGTVAGSDLAMRACTLACQTLDLHMGEVERVLSRMFWLTAPMRRQDEPNAEDGFDQSNNLTGAFLAVGRQHPNADVTTASLPSGGLPNLMEQKPVGSMPSKPARGLLGCCCSQQAVTNGETGE
mmetsp:Transcript_118586/g.342907  ORF Transcript_118586/g.342907 Transcript_118586/m.342907 type:complete len:523 (-) Transcript_118586:406-1974(-)